MAVALVSGELQGAVAPEPAGVMSRCAATREEPTKPDEEPTKPDEEPTMPEKLDATLQAMVDHACDDLRKRMQPETLAAEDIEVLRAERVTWRSSALGCPLPDRAYLMVLTPGVLIVLRSGGTRFEYHATLNGTPFLCEPPAVAETPAPGRNSLDPT